MLAPPAAPRAWPRPIGGQAQNGKTGKLFPPVRELVVESYSSQALALPSHKIRVLNRQGLKRRWLPAHESFIENRQFPSKNIR
jgi:hypothetical protein